MTWFTYLGSQEILLRQALSVAPIALFMLHIMAWIGQSNRKSHQQMALLDQVIQTGQMMSIEKKV